jgi:hypothetical protein
VKSGAKAQPEPRDWTPRYRAYARAMGTPDPDERLRLDEIAWPGGRMAGYILFIGDQWAAWRVARGYPLTAAEFSRKFILTTEDHADFDAFLAVRFPVEARAREEFSIGSL